MKTNRRERRYHTAKRKLEKIVTEFLEFHGGFFKLADILVEVFCTACKKTEEEDR